MAEFFIRRPIVAMVISIVTCIVGLISLSRLPISEYPNVSPTLIQVTSTYRGAAAEAVMESVATPIESKVNGVDKLLYMQSYNANDGKMTLNITFDVGTDVDIDAAACCPPPCFGRRVGSSGVSRVVCAGRLRPG